MAATGFFDGVADIFQNGFAPSSGPSDPTVSYRSETARTSGAALQARASEIAASNNAASSASDAGSSAASGGFGGAGTTFGSFNTSPSGDGGIGGASLGALGSTLGGFTNALSTKVAGLSGLPGTGSTSANSSPQAAVPDYRLRVKFLTDALYGQNGLMKPLISTNGVMFPYTPQISFEQSVEYNPASMVHVNMDYLAYMRTPSVTLNVTGKFTCQTQAEAEYALAAIHFFRTASKMYFGEAANKGDQKKAGLPPPILQVSGYGTYMFNKLNCVLKSHSFSYDPTMDTVGITVNGGTVRLPVMFDLTCSLTVQQTPTKMRKEFDLDAFRTGALMKAGGWI